MRQPSHAWGDAAVAHAGRAGAAPLFRLRRRGVIMEPQPGNALEAGGVLNPGAARGPDGSLYLFPRLVARGNYSRIGIARVLFDGQGDPCGVDRLGIALEPQPSYERPHPGGGGCEDPRVTWVDPLRSYVMTYTAFTPDGPRIALAVSRNMFSWKRLGLASFDPTETGIDFDQVDNKDACLFPVAVPDTAGRPSLAILHRPLLPGTRPEETAGSPAPRRVDVHRESIWISYCPLDQARGPFRLCRFTSHHRLASPVEGWERLKIGVGTPPVAVRQGWLFLYHGVSEALDSLHGFKLQYCAGAMVLSPEHPRRILYRSREPVLSPELPQERRGSVDNVVFPTAIDRRTDLGMPDRFDVYYGMADSRIGAASLDAPAHLPLGGGADSRRVKI